MADLKSYIPTDEQGLFESGVAEGYLDFLATKKALQAVAYDTDNDMLKMTSMQKKWRDSFTGASLNTDKWDSQLGTGASISTSSGTLTIASGTTANAETYILSKETFTIPFKLSIGLTLSQRIANQQFFVEAVSVDPETLLPDGKHSAALLFDGTSATQGKYRVQNGSLTPLDSSATTLPTTASAGVYEIEPFVDECYFHGKTLDSTSGRANSYCRHQQIPDPNALYKIRLRWLNGSSAPASNTNAVVQFITCSDYAEITAEITAGRGQSVVGQALGVNVISMPSPLSVQPALSTTASLLYHKAISAASTNATSVRTSGSNLNGGTVSNVSATTKYFKLYNKSSAPTVGTDTPVITVPIFAGTTLSLNAFSGVVGARFTTGLAYAITGAAADSDTTSVAAGDVIVNINYI